METEPYGYLLKPFNTVDIYTSIEVALRKFESINRVNKVKDFSIKPSTNDGLIFIDDQLFIKEDHLYTKVNVKDILFVKAEVKRVVLKTSSKLYSLRYTFTEFTNILPPEYFIQVHRSYMVDHIGSNYFIVGDLEIPISDKRKQDVYKAFKFV